MPPILYAIVGVGAGFLGLSLLSRLKKPKLVGTPEDVVDYFTRRGFTKAQAIGIAGNLVIESRLKTTAVGDYGKAYGLAQWRDSRLQDLQEYCSKNRLNIKDFYVQLDFIIHELNTKEKRAKQELLATNNVSDSTLAFAVYYERPHSSTYDERINEALKIYNYIK